MDSKAAKEEALPNTRGLRKAGIPPAFRQAKKLTLEARLRGVANWVAEHELWLLAPAVPALMLPEVLPRSAVIAGLLLISLLWLVRWIARGYITIHTPMDMPILGLVAMLPISLYVSVDMQLSFPKLTGILLGVAVFYSIVNTVRTKRDIWLIASLFLLSGVGVSALSLVGTDWAAKFPILIPIYSRLPRLISGVPRSVRGGFHPNEVGGTLILFIPLALSLLWAAPRVSKGKAMRKSQASSMPSAPTLSVQSPAFRTRQWAQGFLDPGWILWSGLGLILAIMSFTLFLSQSRSAFFGLAVALLVLGAIYVCWLRLALVMAIAAGMTILWRFGLEGVGRFLFDIGDSTIGVSTLTFAARMEIWQRAIYMIQDFPYTGVGLNNFDPVAHVMYPFFLIGPDVCVAVTHNNLLQVAVDLGIPGLVACVALLTNFTLIGWRIYRRSNDEFLRALAIGLLCGMLSHQVFGLTDAIALGAKPGVALWAMLGIVVAVDAYLDEHG